MSWIEHVKDTKKKHKNLMLKDVLKIASKTYKKQSGEGLNILDTSQPARIGAPPAIRKLLKESGDEFINFLSVSRKPISSASNKFINFITNGTFDEQKKNLNYDDVFHLALNYKLSNGNEGSVDKSLKVDRGPYIGDGEIKRVPLKKKITLNQLFSNGEKLQGESFWHYNPITANCQKFVTNLLKGSGLLTAELNTFINQNAEGLLKDLSPAKESIIDKGIKVAENIETLITGKGAKKRGRPKKNKN